MFLDYQWSVVCEACTRELSDVQTGKCQIRRTSHGTPPQRKSFIGQRRCCVSVQGSGRRLFWTVVRKDWAKNESKGESNTRKTLWMHFYVLEVSSGAHRGRRRLVFRSFINAVLRFIGRRGAPRVIYSDNGTNFKGAEEDVVETMKSWEEGRIQGSLSQRGVQWVFNPPGASHQAGVWERLIRSTKILRSLVGQRELNDESLRTFLVEVEKIMNDRPITPVSIDPKDLEALTPNHILLLRQNPSTSAGEFESLDKFKARWKHVQMLADAFWEYLPLLPIF